MEDIKAVLNVWLCWELCNKLKKEYQPRLSSMCEIFPAIPTILSSATKHSLNRQMVMRHLTQLMRVDLANKRHVFPKQKVWWDLTMTWKTCWAAWRTRWQTCWWRRPLGVAGWLDAAAHLPKYVCQFEIQTNTICYLDKCYFLVQQIQFIIIYKPPLLMQSGNRCHLSKPNCLPRS